MDHRANEGGQQRPGMLTTLPRKIRGFKVVQGYSRLNFFRRSWPPKGQEEGNMKKFNPHDPVYPSGAGCAPIRGPTRMPIRLRLFLQGRLGFRLEGIQLGLQLQLGLFFHAVNEQDAIQMIGLMLDRAGQQAAAAERNRFAVGVQRLDVHHAGAGDVRVNLGKTQAAFPPWPVRPPASPAG